MEVTISFTDNSFAQAYYPDFNVAGEIDGYKATMEGFDAPDDRE